MTKEQFNSLRLEDQDKLRNLTAQFHKGNRVTSTWVFMQMINPGSCSMQEFVNFNHSLQQLTHILYERRQQIIT